MVTLNSITAEPKKIIIDQATESVILLQGIEIEKIRMKGQTVFTEVVKNMNKDIDEKLHEKYSI